MSDDDDTLELKTNPWYQILKRNHDLPSGIGECMCTIVISWIMTPKNRWRQQFVCPPCLTVAKRTCSVCNEYKEHDDAISFGICVQCRHKFSTTCLCGKYCAPDSHNTCDSCYRKLCECKDCGIVDQNNFSRKKCDTCRYLHTCESCNERYDYRTTSYQHDVCACENYRCIGEQDGDWDF